MKADTLRKIHEAYLNGSEKEKQELEKKYGLSQLRKLVQEIGVTTEVAWTIHQTYLNGTEEEKQELETKYSQKQLRKLVKELGINAGASENICEAYLNGSQEIKLELEKKYGQKEVKKLVAEHCSEQWLEENSKRCPHCFVPVEKVDGCNKMVCYKCHSFFCWLCLTILPKHNPYDHFKDESVRCYGRLNVGAINDEEDNNDENYVGP